MKRKAELEVENLTFEFVQGSLLGIKIMSNLRKDLLGQL